jgi:hypothetical protein
VRVQRIGSQQQDFFCSETVSVGTRGSSVAPEGCLLYVEEPIAIHVGHRAHGIAAPQAGTVQCLASYARVGVAAGDASLLHAVVRDEVHETLAVHVLAMSRR